MARNTTITIFNPLWQNVTVNISRLGRAAIGNERIVDIHAYGGKEQASMSVTCQMGYATSDIRTGSSQD